MDQRAERHGQEHELTERARAGERDQAGVAPRRAPERQRALDQREAERQDQREMADLDDHWPAPSPAASPWRQTPACFSASATSGGM